MANHVRNIVKMQGIGSLLLFTKEEGTPPGGQKERFDFQKILPMPESLNIDSGTMEYLVMEAALTRIADIINNSIYAPFYISVTHGSDASLEERMLKRGVTDEEIRDLGPKYLANIIKHGHSSWYSWRRENWGTKWNSYDLERVDDDTIAFSTAWSNPGPIIEELSAQYPDLMIEHWWADEDIGCNAGYRCIQDGCDDTVTPEDGCQDALEIYVKCWGMDDRLERTGEGTLRYIGD